MSTVPFLWLVWLYLPRMPNVESVDSWQYFYKKYFYKRWQCWQLTVFLQKYPNIFFSKSWECWQLIVFFYKSIQIYSQKVESVDSWQFFLQKYPNIFSKSWECWQLTVFFNTFIHNNDTRSTMSEPAKGTAIEIMPKTETSSVRVFVWK